MTTGNSECSMLKIKMMCCCSHYVKITTLMGYTDPVFIIAFLLFKAISTIHNTQMFLQEFGDGELIFTNNEIFSFLFTYLLTQCDNYKLNIFFKVSIYHINFETSLSWTLTMEYVLCSEVKL